MNEDANKIDNPKMPWQGSGEELRRFFWSIDTKIPGLAFKGDKLLKSFHKHKPILLKEGLFTVDSVGGSRLLYKVPDMPKLLMRVMNLLREAESLKEDNKLKFFDIENPEYFKLVDVAGHIADEMPNKRVTIDRVKKVIQDLENEQDLGDKIVDIRWHSNRYKGFHKGIFVHDSLLPIIKQKIRDSYEQMYAPVLPSQWMTVDQIASGLDMPGHVIYDLINQIINKRLIDDGLHGKYRPTGISKSTTLCIAPEFSDLIKRIIRGEDLGDEYKDILIANDSGR